MPKSYIQKSVVLTAEEHAMWLAFKAVHPEISFNGLVNLLLEKHFDDTEKARQAIDGLFKADGFPTVIDPPQADE